MKPDWSNAPKNAQWLALDKEFMGSQRWFWYSDKPVWQEGIGMWIPKLESVCSVAGVGEGDPRESLEERV